MTIITCNRQTVQAAFARYAIRTLSSHRSLWQGEVLLHNARPDAALAIRRQLSDAGTIFHGRHGGSHCQPAIFAACDREYIEIPADSRTPLVRGRCRRNLDETLAVLVDPHELLLVESYYSLYERVLTHFAAPKARQDAGNLTGSQCSLH